MRLHSGIVAALAVLTTAFSAQAANPRQLEAVRLIDLIQNTAWTGNAQTSPTTSKIRFAVSSSGCTSEKDFTLHIDRVGSTQSIRLVRNTRDACKAMPRETLISFEVKSLKVGSLSPIVVANPVMPNDANYEPGTLISLD